MFVVARSVFWLLLAYMVIKPGVDLPDPAQLSAYAVASGSQVIAHQVQNVECDTIQCLGGQAVLAVTLRTPALSGQPLPTKPIEMVVPLPRARPDHIG